MHKRKHNGITLLTPAFMSRRFKFGTRRAIEKRGQLSIKLTNPSWPQAVREYWNEKKPSCFFHYPYGVGLLTPASYASKMGS